MTNEEKEELRRATLQAVAIRHPAALTVKQIARAVKREVPFLFEESDLTAALELLAGLSLVEFAVEELGVTKYWRATAAGVLKIEREG